jgi:hypothetical protein
LLCRESRPIRPDLLHSEHPFLERAITPYERIAARWAFLNITTGDMELALQNSAVVARNATCMRVGMFTSVSNAMERLPVERV